MHRNAVRRHMWDSMMACLWVVCPLDSAALTYPLKPPYAGEYPATSHLGEIEICGPPRSYGFVHTSLGSIGVCLYIANK